MVAYRLGGLLVEVASGRFFAGFFHTVTRSTPDVLFSALINTHWLVPAKPSIDMTADTTADCSRSVNSRLSNPPAKADHATSIGNNPVVWIFILLIHALPTECNNLEFGSKDSRFSCQGKAEIRERKEGRASVPGGICAARRGATCIAGIRLSPAPAVGGPATRSLAPL